MNNYGEEIEKERWWGWFGREVFSWPILWEGLPPSHVEHCAMKCPWMVPPDCSRGQHSEEWGQWRRWPPCKLWEVLARRPVEGVVSTSNCVWTWQRCHMGAQRFRWLPSDLPRSKAHLRQFIRLFCLQGNQDRNNLCCPLQDFLGFHHSCREAMGLSSLGIIPLGSCCSRSVFWITAKLVRLLGRQSAMSRWVAERTIKGDN